MVSSLTFKVQWQLHAPPALTLNEIGNGLLFQTRKTTSDFLWGSLSALKIRSMKCKPVKVSHNEFQQTLRNGLWVHGQLYLPLTETSGNVWEMEWRGVGELIYMLKTDNISSLKWRIKNILYLSVTLDFLFFFPSVILWWMYFVQYLSVELQFLSNFARLS
jgi:hypothetical protein